ncbi:hypothetical protein AMTR_s00034p00241900 [Amborella trichopoda]|uniref:K+ potassium transporter integral membrane domain-containing protein n=1 Tax=Amborella trichopoda TaxID=13333 RepID=W1PW11_AMBTC|nr:hypothetical protein AMTR_s00034p00241900 [Amborella trichopoda]
MIGFLKYVFIVLHADDHGERGTFALYSLLNQHINFKNRINGDQTKRLDFDDSNLKNYSGGSLQSKANKLLEKSSMALSFLTFIVLLGTCMVIGDGALTLAIYVLSVVQGMQSRSRKINTNHVKWEMLGAIVLCIRGVEAMFADMGHFNMRGIQIAIFCLVYPCILLTYGGDAAYLIKNLENISNTFYSSVPSPVFFTHLCHSHAGGHSDEPGPNIS